ncbi:MAG: glycosyltransferase, partial [Gammaproteobacteria bacterium]|nr:glycosyltransferase [Gammaproteobacteria bacterium]
EAMACGMVTIAADSPGIRDLLEHQITGWLCEPTADGIVQALGELSLDTKLADKLSENAANAIRNYFSLKRIASRERGILEEISVAVGARV